MQKVWKWIKSKNKDLKNGDEDRFPNKRKWHSYIFPGRGDRQPTRSITENFDQVASNSMPTIVPNKQRSNSAKNEQKRRRSQRLPSQKHQNGELTIKSLLLRTNANVERDVKLKTHLAPTTTPFETMTVSLNIEMSPQSSFKSKDFILVDRKNSRANQQVFSATEAHALAIQAIQAVEPSGSAGVIITDIAGPEEEVNFKFQCL
jgi:hypothetical protein